MRYLLSILFTKNYKIGLTELFHYFVMNRIFHRKYNIHLTINGYKFTIPNEHHIFYTLHEVFTWKLYRKLVGCKHVLDLGGFIGDTGVWLAQHNMHVSIYEANPSNFKFVKTNTSLYTNISAYNGAVIGIQNNGTLYYEGGDFNAGGRIVDCKTDLKISGYNIQDILSENEYDGLKMDIEGGEYDIIEYFIKHKDVFPFKKGYIEFHNYHDNDKHSNSIDMFIDYLKNQGINIEFEDVYGHPIHKHQIKYLDPKIFVMYFSQ